MPFMHFPKYEYITLIKQGRMKEMYFVVMVFIHIAYVYAVHKSALE